MNRASLDASIKSPLALALRPGKIVVADNLSFHTSSQVLELLRAQGIDLIFLQLCSPDLNPIEMVLPTSRP